MSEDRADNSGRGLFITFEGGEGVGKTTQIARLATALQSRGHEVITSREPGGTAGAEAVRHAILEACTGEPFGPEMEALLFAAARSDHVEQTIRPAVSKGKIALIDRFIDSTRAYQGVSGALSKSFLASLERVAINGMMPDMTILLDLPPSIGLKRAGARRIDNAMADRFEKEELAAHEMRRQAFLDIAAREPGRVIIIDAAADQDTVAKRVLDAVLAHPATKRLQQKMAVAAHG